MDALQALEGQPIQPWRNRAFVIALATSALAMFAATWPLWIPTSTFPQVPLLQAAGDIPLAFQWVTLGCVVLSLLSVIVTECFSSPDSRRIAAWPPWGWLVFASSLALLLVINQNRLQSWAYQFVVYALVLAALPPRRSFTLLRCLTISIYFWAAVAKLDYSFTQTLGQQFLDAAFSLASVNPKILSPEIRTCLALVLPIAELFIALGFCLPLSRLAWLRRFFIAAALGMHCLLILLLSPLGLHHQVGVLLWNVWFIAQALLLFGFPCTAAASESNGTTNEQRPLAMIEELNQVCVEFLVLLVIALPAFAVVNRCDHWIAWGLYAPNNSRATLFVHRRAANKLPDDVALFLDPADGQSPWRKLCLDKWALAECGAPIYPQDRFQIGAAEDVIQRYGLSQQQFQIVVESPASRWTGRRQITRLLDTGKFEQASQRFLFNSRPKPQTAE